MIVMLALVAWLMTRLVDSVIPPPDDDGDEDETFSLPKGVRIRVYRGRIPPPPSDEEPPPGGSLFYCVFNMCIVGFFRS